MARVSLEVHDAYRTLSGRSGRAAAYRFHLGSGDLRFPGWINLDLRYGHDLRRGLPHWTDASVDAVYSCHFLEHVTHEEGEALLAEVHRVLRPGGTARIAVPDLERFARAYVDGDEEFARTYFERYCPPGEEAAPRRYAGLGAVGALLAIVHGWEHRAMYDETVLRLAFERAGFAPASIERHAFGEGGEAGLAAWDLRYDDHSLFVEATKGMEEPS